MSISEAERKAKLKYERKRREQPQFPRQYITNDYNEKILKLMSIYGTKKEVLLKGIDELCKINKIN